MTKTFINFTNHPSSCWGTEQLAAARQYGEIVDIPFPAVDPEASAEEINALADVSIVKIRRYEDPVVLVQGEFTLVFAVVERLKMMGIKAVAACAVREVTESVMEDGTPSKTVIFRFCRFREYV